MAPFKEIEQATRLEAEGDIDGARSIYRSILKKHPGHPAALKHLATLAGQAGNTDLAGHYCLQSLESDPNQADVWTNLGMILTEQNRPHDAEKALSNALKLDPRYAPAWLWMASVPMMVGDTAKALEYLEKAVTLDPDLSEAYPILAQTSNILPDHTIVERLTEKIETDGPAQDLANCHYALAYVYQRAGDDRKFFHHLDEANRLQRTQTGAWREGFDRGFKTLTDAMTGDFLSGGADKTSPLTPIFIVGLPRSGSTLVEQMLACHPDIGAGGEIPYFPKFLQKVSRAKTGALPPDSYTSMTRDDLREAANLYLTRLGQEVPGAAFVTDKMPWNFQLIGPIAAALPGAKIVNVTRNALDCGFSIYRNRFAATLPYCCDHDDYAWFRRRYLDLMGFWNEALPGFVLDVEYEALVEDPERELKKICDFCSVGFDPAMLDFHTTRRPVRTLSQLQVMKPLSSKAIGTARRYGEYLQPLKNALGDYGVPY